MVLQYPSYFRRHYPHPTSYSIHFRSPEAKVAALKILTGGSESSGHFHFKLPSLRGHGSAFWKSACRYPLFFIISRDTCKDQAHGSISTLEPNPKQDYVCCCKHTVMPKVSFIKQKKRKREIGLKNYDLSSKIVLTLKVPIHFFKIKLPIMYHIYDVLQHSSHGSHLNISCSGMAMEKNLQYSHAKSTNATKKFNMKHFLIIPL